MLIHQMRVDIHRHIRRSAERGRLIQVARLAKAIAKKYGAAQTEVEAEIVNQAVLEDVGLELGGDSPRLS
jgi:hypothetical protein